MTKQKVMTFGDFAMTQKSSDRLEEEFQDLRSDVKEISSAIKGDFEGGGLLQRQKMLETQVEKLKQRTKQNRQKYQQIKYYGVVAIIITALLAAGTNWQTIATALL